VLHRFLLAAALAAVVLAAPLLAAAHAEHLAAAAEHGDRHDERAPTCHFCAHLALDGAAVPAPSLAPPRCPATPRAAPDAPPAAIDIARGARARDPPLPV
jgi:hypothetical protein